MTLQERLDEAEAALHDLKIGRQVRAYTDQNGERVEYHAGSASEFRANLTAYVAELREALGLALPHGPMRVFL